MAEPFSWPSHPQHDSFRQKDPAFSSTPMQQQTIWRQWFEAAKKEASERMGAQLSYADHGCLLTSVHRNIAVLFTEVRGSQL